MKRFLSLLVGLLILSLLSGCLLQPFGKGGSKFKPSSARDVIDYSALDFKEGEVLIKG